uniref:Leucine-rich repeat-containing protein 51 n=1 Tax=Monopterus albus TaxID=43700 RepID=A0A3Q3KK64_MONAL|nr:leucine-rich repeat-containing protein 51-like [Monopterus albus]XP_020475624.1 leucine-rich repeat-containing protein 51-like [Monopterus albus]XP_020475625.1 leucine-rich repeat-containing protein 51-like [Monopterus albus]XP_020475626.1 leucine-rich repeat-containing protein 51-like [Monopterus albus]XP_020475627.1 leucine-rich repeat-containing protein 51-like [Monopterus albus]
MYGAPVDLSFKNICSLADAWAEEPSSGLRPLKKNSEMKYLSRSLRLNNNNITDLPDLPMTVSHFLADPSQLAWLDLSFNKITHIDHVLCELHELRVLYLHGNSICILSEVDRLGALPHLRSITLHGNTIETNKAYRNHVISALPHIKTMDFSAVTQQERVMANIWHRSRNSRRTLQ